MEDLKNKYPQGGASVIDPNGWWVRSYYHVEERPSLISDMKLKLLNEKLKKWNQDSKASSSEGHKGLQWDCIFSFKWIYNNTFKAAKKIKHEPSIPTKINKVTDVTKRVGNKTKNTTQSTKQPHYIK